MEEIRAYIESGVLELYALGDISSEEKLQVETMASQHPAIQAELDEIERATILYADAYAVEPAPQLRDRVLNSLLTNFADDRRLKTVQHEDRDDVISRRLAAVSAAKPTASIFYKYGFAASVLLLCVSIAATAVLYTRLQDSQQKLITLTLSNQKFANQVNNMSEEINVFRDPSYKLIQLKGTQKTPASALTVAWSASKSKVLVDLQTAKLPAADKGHQYQLWAIADGKPVDLGVFDTAATDSADMKTMKSIGTAQAFAVTIEPRGGSVNPTMDQMVVIASL
ncbi:anti-sigma factor [Mucilaginibacter terrae]|uniref:Regulator of SigK n=1 Tax=Mucilaginibacter terrae TaxID=1955052 RepID=A0ABU3GX77_9SPHI|nr:anti-sigma factor [Mucilaginibacter terrae]MDT3404374.1 anti-sigma-K factor RskA [Mucilaginibacter terrae]